MTIPFHDEEAADREGGDSPASSSPFNSQGGETEMTRIGAQHEQAPPTVNRAVQDDGENDNEDDDDDVTVILLDPEDERHHTSTVDWIHQHGPEMEARRRTILLRELKRIQRSSFLHFALLCLIPTVLLLVVIFALMAEAGGEDCTSEVTKCELEPRTFVNAFTTRCVCEPIPVGRVPWEENEGDETLD